MTTEPAWLVEARKFLGTKEIAGPRDNPVIVDFFKDVGQAWVQDDETAWCAAFVGAMLKKAGIAGTGKLNARSYLDWGKHLDEPVPGCVVVFKRGNSSWQGHVAFFLRDLGDHIEVLGGNQSNSVSVARYSKASLLGYRWPSSVAVAHEAPGTLKVGSRGERVRVLQEQLKRLRYPVGRADGIYGNLTRDAVLAWQADRHLNLTGSVTPDEMDMIEASEPRELSEARTEAKASEVAQESRIAANSSTTVKVATTATTAIAAAKGVEETGLLDQAQGVADQVTQAKGVFEQFSDAAKTMGIDVVAFVSSHSTVILLVVVAVVGFYSWRTLRARVDDHRSGKTL